MKFRNLLLLILLLVQGLALASVREVPLDELEPTREQRQSTLIILKVINEYHYKKHALDDEMSRAILHRYLEVLDPNKNFFTRDDIDRFNVLGDRLDNDLADARLDAAFSIFRVYRQRVDERVAQALKLLQREYDFTIDEEYRFNREKAPWAADVAELDELWRKKVKNDILSLKLKEKPLDEIRDTLGKRYSGIQRRIRQMESDDVFQTFINSYTLSLEPHTSYMSPRLSENFDISMRLSLEGIGAVLRNENEYTVVQRTVVGGPADTSGQVEAGDRIIGVGQDADGEIVDVIGWRLQDVVDLIRGPKGTTVRLQLLPEDEGSAGRSKLVTLERNKIKLEDQAAQKFVIDGIGGSGKVRVGVIDIPAFYRDFRGYSKGDKDFTSTTRDVRRLIGELEQEGVDGIVIDLRENGGGSLAEATELTGLFIPEGPVVQVKNASGDLDIEQDPDPAQVYSGPLAVLVDRHSASASEIFAGAIQDYGRGIIIGEPTFGKGTVQTLVDLGRFVRYGDKNLGRLRLTMAQFFRINGGSTQFKGVVPDIIYPSAVRSEDQGERSLDNALPWASIRAVDYRPQGLGSLDSYRKMHQLRIKDDPGFTYLKQVELMLKEVRDQETVSLVEKDREIEWNEREKRRKAEKNRFLVAIGEKPETDEEEGKPKRSPRDDMNDPVARVMINEAAHILADYISGHSRAAMVN